MPVRDMGADNHAKSMKYIQNVLSKPFVMYVM